MVLQASMWETGNDDWTVGTFWSVPRKARISPLAGLNGSALPQDHHDLKPEYGEVILTTEGSSCEMHAVDFDEDGDLDLILGEFSRTVINPSLPVPRYFERVSGKLVERIGLQNPLNPFGGMIYAIVDVDGDGHLDVVLKGLEHCRYPSYLSMCTTEFRYFERAADGSFVEPPDNPFQHMSLFQFLEINDVPEGRLSHRRLERRWFARHHNC